MTTPPQEPRTGGSIFDRPESEITKEEWRAAAESWKRQHDEVFALGIRASMAGDEARAKAAALIDPNDPAVRERIIAAVNATRSRPSPYVADAVLAALRGAK